MRWAPQSLGGRIYVTLGGAGDTAAAVLVDDEFGGKLPAAELAANIAFGARLRSYRFDKYRTKEKPEKKPSLKRLTVMAKDLAGARRRLSRRWASLADGVFFTRDLVSEPANIIYPESFAARGEEAERASASRSRCWTRSRWPSSAWARCSASGRAARANRQLVVMRWNGAQRPQGAADRLRRQGRHLRHRRHLASSRPPAWKT